MTIRTIIAVGTVVSAATLPLLSATPTTSPADENQVVRASESQPASAKKPQVSITALFTPGDDCIKAIVNELDAANKTIRVQAYSLTSDAIGAALVSAKKRGVDVRVIFGSQSARQIGSEAEYLLKNDVVVRVDGAHYHAHNKIVIIDDSVVITGSFNFSERAQNENAENLVIIKGHHKVAQRFSRNWSLHARHSPIYIASAELATAETVADKKASEPPAQNLTPPVRSKTADRDQETVYVTKHGKRYHCKDCQFARSGATTMSRAKAIKSGKTPCQRCKPD